jgi:hypothetical protein
MFGSTRRPVAARYVCVIAASSASSTDGIRLRVERASLKPDGVLLAFFTTAQPQPGTRPEYTRHVVVNATTLQHRPYPAARARQRPLPNRDIQLMFEPLRIAEQFLLKTNLREVLFRKKPAEAGTSHR